MKPTDITTSHPEIFVDAGAAEKVADGDYGFVKPEHEEFPPILIIAVTNVCNMACIHCAHPIIKKDEGYRGTFMKPEIHSKIVEETRPYKDQLWVFRYAADGESILHPNFYDFVEETKNAGIGPVDLTQPIPNGASKVSFTTELPAGKTQLQTWFIQKAKGESRGAYYVSVSRLPQ
jgi:hypothetical protein